MRPLYKGNVAMKVMIVGAAGMIGQKLTERLLLDGQLAGKPLSELTLCDAVPTEKRLHRSVGVVNFVADLTAPGQAEKLLDGRPDVVFHLAAIVSGEAEENFDRGYSINVDGTRALLEAIRNRESTPGSYVPRFIFTSSIAVFGAPLPDPIPDDFHQTPQTSYGTQKAICELLISDYTRRGFVDGYALRLPTICVRPGKPNKAASGFFSSIIREPLNGQQAVLPVEEEVMHWHASPRAAVGFLLHCAEIDGTRVGSNRAITMPGVAVTVGEQIDALRRVAGDTVASRIIRRPDAFVQQIVSNWPCRFQADRAIELGFHAERDFDEIIRVHIEDEMA